MTLFGGLFDDLAPALRDELAATKRPANFAAGDTLFSAGERPDRVYLIRSGRVKVWRAGRSGHSLTLYYLGPGAPSGMVAIARDVPLPVGMTAASPVLAWYWPAASLRRWLREDTQLASNALRITGEALETMIDRLDDVTNARADQQIGRALLRLAGEHADWGEDGHVTVDVSRQDLADLTGTTLYTASRTLSDWDRQGLVESGRRRVVIKDPGALAALSEVD